MTTELTCAHHGCERDGITFDPQSGHRFCVPHRPYIPSGPCDAIVKRDRDTNDPLERCGSGVNTIWYKSAAGNEFVRCEAHRRSEWRRAHDDSR